MQVSYLRCLLWCEFTLYIAGSVSVFLTADGGYTWSAVQLLVAADRAHADKLGTSVAVSGTVIVAGATKGGGGLCAM